MLTPKIKHYYCVFFNLHLWTKSWMKKIFCPPLFISRMHHSPASLQTLAVKGCANHHGFCQYKGWMNSQEFSLQLWRTYPSAETLPFAWNILRNTSVSKCKHKNPLQSRTWRIQEQIWTLCLTAQTALYEDVETSPKIWGKSTQAHQNF